MQPGSARGRGPDRLAVRAACPTGPAPGPQLVKVLPSQVTPVRTLAEGSGALSPQKVVSVRS